MTVRSTVLRSLLARVALLGRGSRKLRRLLAGLSCGLLAAAAVHANPTGPSVAHGTAQFANPDANTLDITTSSNAIINWQGFSIGAGETTRFTQPSASSAVLNRVTGSDPSSILGQLLSNGRVFLVNPQGIVFGEDAVVDTAGLVASTLGIGDEDFLAGRYEFDAGPDAGNITNHGLVKSGADGVFLLAPSIENSGVIRTDGGDLVLAAGRTITLTSLDLDGVRVEVRAAEDEALNLGELIAERGAAGVFAGSIRNSGTVEANAVTVDEDGTIRLVARNDLTLEADGKVAADGPSGGEIHIESESGTTWVSGEVSARASEGSGGTIRLLGHRVGLEGATVDASGPAGGGEVLVGGDVSGEGEVPTADSTFVSADSNVSADALDDGDGGKVVVFAESFANVQGSLSARGGSEGGDGGFVETSGLKSLAIAQTPDTTAPNGDGGEWLIDPNNIDIVPDGGASNITGSDPFTSTNDGARLGIDLIVAALSGGQTVRVQTTESGGNSQGGDITLNAPLDIERTAGTNTLVLDAHRHIAVNEEISGAAGGAVLNLDLDAEGEIFIDADMTLHGGELRTRAFEVEVSNGAHVIVDGVAWTVEADEISVGDDGPGIVTARNGAEVDPRVQRIEVGASGDGRLVIESGAEVVTGYGEILIGQDVHATGEVVVTGPDSWFGSEDHRLVVGDSGTGELVVENGAAAGARWITVGNVAGSRGTVTVTGSGSWLVAFDDDNSITVGRAGTGTLHVRDGGLVETLNFYAANSWSGEVVNSGVGEVFVSGVAADGTRSRVIVSPAYGRNTGIWADEAGLVRLGRYAGQRGHLEIRDGGLFRILDGDGTHGPLIQLARNKGSVGTVVIDGAGSSLEVIQNAPAVHGNPDIDPGPKASLGRRGGGTTTIRNGGRLLVRGESAVVQVASDFIYQRNPDPDTGPVDQRSEVRIESGGRMEIDGERAFVVIGNGGPSADGVVTVSGPGSTLVTKGANNAILVGDEGTGTLHVLDGGLVDTLILDVGRSTVGRLVIRGAASDGTRSRVIVSPAHGKFSGEFENSGGFARAGRNAGSHGFIEILDGGLLRVLDGNGTHGSEFDLARNKGSAGTLLIDGAGSRLEVIQNAPAVHGDPNAFPGPSVQLGRRGSGTTTIRNGGRLVVRGESAFARISRDSINPNFPDSDPGSIDQRSIVSIESGGRMEIGGEGARLVIGDSGPAADGEVTVTGTGAVLDVSGAGNRLVVGDDGGRGRLEVGGGGAVGYGELVVGANGTTNVSDSEPPEPPEPPPEEVQEQVDAVTDEVLPAREPTAQSQAREAVEAEQEAEDEEDEEDEESVDVDEGGETEEQEEELQPCPV